MGIGLSGSGSRVQGFRVDTLGFLGFGFRIEGSRVRFLGLRLVGLRVSGLRHCRVEDLRFRVLWG